ncbi:Eukaryotic porin family protein [Theileria parva strain Muguga]|uniref:Mitochondrial import receptor subunit tom40, putative n=1 Tax=Theileria parva TaxID=5875 RepID=Q4N6X4_THEPA|nr:mitochondrial import receptor subunit Tom40 [Theileria parva strain Muguga]EAN34284.1 Eukaryotic porin family protein [Theileria parva strain Muguga]|eukprot:XP_766567.1 mitochondrial import receptor subunit Tom40 [Theileria parva strain Muguga]
MSWIRSFGAGSSLFNNTFKGISFNDQREPNSENIFKDYFQNFKEYKIKNPVKTKTLDSKSINGFISERFQSLLSVAHCSEEKQESKEDQQHPQPSPFDLLVYENLAREYKNVITQDNYDGFRLEADRQITKNLQASHSLYLGTLLKDVGYIYQIGANYASDDGKKFLMFKVGLDGNIALKAFAKLGNRLELKAVTNSRLKIDNQSTFEVGADYLSDYWTATLKCCWQGTFIWNICYTHQILPCFTVGSEVTYIDANGASIGSLSARYVRGDNIFTCQLTRQPDFKHMDFSKKEINCARVQYTRKVNDRLSLATELELSPSIKESALRVGWEYLFRHARVQGNIDSCGRIAMQTQDYNGFGVSGCIDYWNNIYRFGFMMHLLPQPEQNQENPQPA